MTAHQEQPRNNRFDYILLKTLNCILLDKPFSNKKKFICGDAPKGEAYSLRFDICSEAG
jgi:hypothetical protein